MDPYIYVYIYTMKVWEAETTNLKNIIFYYSQINDPCESLWCRFRYQLKTPNAPALQGKI